MSQKKVILKVLLLGDANVGKSALINRFVHEKFESDYKTTIGSDFSAKQVPVEGKYVTLQIWDTAGQERYQSLGQTFYRGTDGLILVYDRTNEETFESIKRWKDKFVEETESTVKEVPMILVANKSDMDEIVEDEAGRELARSIELDDFFVTSAYKDENVTAVFEKLTKLCLERKTDREPVVTSSVVEANRATQSGSSCC